MTANFAAWSPSPKGDLEIKEAPLYSVQGDEILIKVCEASDKYVRLQTDETSL
jgi:hypothetical protein